MTLHESNLSGCRPFLVSRGFRAGYVMVVFCVAFLSGCATGKSNIPSHVVDGSAHQRFSVRGVEFTFETLGTHQRAKVCVDCLRIVSPGESVADIRMLERAFSFQSPEGKWLLIYLQHVALRYLNDSYETPGTLSRFSNAGTVIKGEHWWIADANQAFYNTRSLAIKKGADVWDLGLDGPSGQWLPFTADSYSNWWVGVDRNLNLERRIRGPSPSTQSAHSTVFLSHG